MEHHSGNFFADPRLWVGISFLIFFLIFGRKLGSVVGAALDKRSFAIRFELNEAARLRREAEEMLVDARAKREAALLEAERMLTQARAEAARMAETAQADAATAASRRERLALERISAAEKAAIAEVRLAAADIAARAAHDVIARDFGPDADGQLIDHAIQGLPAALAGRRAA